MTFYDFMMKPLIEKWRREVDDAEWTKLLNGAIVVVVCIPACDAGGERAELS